MTPAIMTFIFTDEKMIQLINITLCEFEDCWVRNDETQINYFFYPQDELFRGELKSYFKTKEYYETKFGPVLSACLCIEYSPNGEYTAWLSPSCEICCDGLENVDHIVIPFTKHEITALLFLARICQLKHDIDRCCEKLSVLSHKMSETKNILEVENNE